MPEAMLDEGCSSPQISEWVVDPNRKRSNSLKVFSKSMVHAWRRRGEEIRHLQKEIELLMEEYTQNKNTVHMCKALKQVEHERNGDLHLELMKLKLSINEDNASILSLTKVKEQLLHEVDSRRREHVELQAVADQRKTELYAALREQRIDENRLSQEEEAINQLRTKNAALVSEVALLRRLQMEHKMNEKCLTKELEEATGRMKTMQEELNFLQDRVRGWNNNEPQENEPQVQSSPVIDQLKELSSSIDSFPTVDRSTSNRSSVFPMFSQSVFPCSQYPLMRAPSHVLQNGFRIPALFRIVSLVLANLRSRSK